VSPLEFWRSRPWAGLLLLGAVAGTVIGVLRPIAPAPTQRTEHDLEWLLPPPQVVARFDENRFAQLRDLRIWGSTEGQAAGVDGRPQVPNWRLTGIILEPAPIALVLADGATAVARIALGAALPDAARLIAVSAAGIVYERDGCRRERVLYAGDEANREGECLPAPGDPNAAPPVNGPNTTQQPESESPSGTKSSE